MMRTAARNRRPGQDPLSPRARALVRLFVMAPILAFFVASVLQLVKVVKIINGDISNIVASVLHQTLNHEFKIGRISYYKPGLLSIDNVAVSSKNTWKASHGEAGLSVRQVVIKYDFNSLIADPSSAGHYIQTITLDHPTALIERLTAKTFNFTDLISTKKKKHNKPFIAKINVVQAAVYFRDFTSPLDPNGKVSMNSVYQLNGMVDCDSDELITFKGGGVGTDRFSAISATGNVSRRKPLQYNLTADITNGDAAYWVRFLKLVPQAHVLSGRVDLRLSVLVPPARTPAPTMAKVGTDVILLGDGAVRGGNVDWLDKKYLLEPVHDIAGRFSFTDTEVNVNGAVSIAGQRIGVAGAIAVTPPNPPSPGAKPSNVVPPPPTVALDLSSPHFDASRLASAFRGLHLPPGVSVSGASGNIAVQGVATDPVAHGDVSIGAIGYAGNRLTGVHAKIDLVHKLLGVQSAEFAVNGTGHGHLTASVDTSHTKPAYTASGHLDGIDLSVIRLPKPGFGARAVPVSGKLTADFITKDDGTGASLTSNVSVAEGRVASTPVHALRGRIVVTEHKSVDLEKVVVEAAGGRALISGSVSLNTPKPQIALSINAANISIKPAVSPFSDIDVGGIAYYNGLLAGPVDNPTATGTVNLFRAHYGRYEADVINGDITANRNVARIYDLHVHRFPADADIAGTVTDLSGHPQLALKAAVHGVQLDDIGELLGETGRKRAAGLLPKGTSQANVASTFSGLQGSLDGTFDVAGDVRKPRVGGHVDLKDITAGGNHIDAAQSDVSVTDQQVRLRNIVLRSGKATATGDLAWWPQTGKIQAVAAGSNIELFRFRSYYGQFADLRGDFDFSGSLAGTLANPVVTFGVVASDVTVDGQQLAQFTGFGKYANGILTSDIEPWEFTLIVPVVSSNSTAANEQITYSIDKFKVTVPAAIGRTGEPAFDIAAHIPSTAPEHLSHIIDTLRNSKFGASPQVVSVIHQYEQLPRPTEAAIAIPSLTVQGTASNPKVAAHITITNAVSGQNHVASVDTGLVYSPAGLSIVGGEIAGVSLDGIEMRQGIHEAGKALAATVTATDIVYNGVALDKINLTGGYGLDKRHITLDDLRLGYAKAYIDAYGDSYLDGDINADLDISNLPLSIFNGWMPHSRVLAGNIGTLSALVTGKTSSPDLQATVSVQNPDVLPAQTEAKTGLKTASTTTDASAVVDEINSETISVSSPVPGGSKILSIGDLSAYRNGTKLATLTGTIPFKWDRLKWDNLESMLAQLPTDQPLHASLTIGDLSILRLVSNSIDAKRTGGSLVASVDANASGKASGLNGSVKITNASLALLVPERTVGPTTIKETPSIVDTYLKDVNADVGFDLKGAKIASFTGKSSNKGDFAVSGSVDFGSNSNLDLNVALHGFEVNERSRQSILSRDYSSAAQGKITGAVAITGPFDAPVISNPGTQPIVISDATIGVPSAPSGGGASKPVYTIDPKFDLHFAVGGPHKPVTVKNALLNAEVSGIADIGGSVAAPVFHSDLTVNKGKVILGGPVLRIDPGGTVVLNYPTLNTDTTPGAEPVILTERVDLSARTTIPASPSQLASTSSGIGGAIAGGASSSNVSNADTTRTDYHITVHIVGYLGTKDLTTDYQSDPRLDRPQILALLTPQTALLGLLRGGSGSGDIVAQQLTAIVNSVGVGMLLDPVETNIAQALGLSSFVVDYSPDAPVVVTLTKPLGHRFEASFQRSFGARAPSAVNSLISNSQYQLKLSFSLSRRLRLSISTDDQYNNTAALEGVINFN